MNCRLLLCLSILATLSLSGFADNILRPNGAIDVPALSEFLRTKGATWTAAENEFTRMSADQRKQFAKTIVPSEPLPDENKRGLERIMTFDPVLDWRNINGNDYTTPIRNQGSCGSCWAFAVCAAAEAVINVAENMPTLDINLSEQYLVSTCCSWGDCDGGYVYYTFEFLQSNGIPDEACYPYRAANSPCNDRCSGW